MQHAKLVFAALIAAGGLTVGTAAYANDPDFQTDMMQTIRGRGVAPEPAGYYRAPARGYGAQQYDYTNRYNNMPQRPCGRVGRNWC